MEPSKDAVVVRLARLNNLFLGRSVAGNGLRQSLHRDGLLDALSVLYDECNNETLKKSDQQIAKFVEMYRSVLSELRQMRVNISDFEVKDIIGRGHFGEVHVVREKHTGDVYAMKSVRKETTLKQRETAFVGEERDIMASAGSPWIVALQYAFQDTSQLYLVMEFCPGGDLGGLLERRGGTGLPEEEAAHYLAELVLAVQALHSLGYIHRDLKPDNILIDRCGHLKLGDLGSAAQLPASGLVSSPVPVGTPHYIAPELLRALEEPKKHPHGIPCDYWSLGVVAFELVTGHTPWPGSAAGQVFASILRHARPAWPGAGPGAAYRDLTARLMSPAPAARPGHDDLLRHVLFKRVQWGSLREQPPPVVPVVRAQDDASNFSRPERLQRVPSVGSLRTRTHFSGRNLPFIGFTYAPEMVPIGTPGAGGDAGNEAEDEAEGEAFLNASLNSTAICLAGFREMETLLESRKKEIEALHKRLAAAECAAALGEERARLVRELEDERIRLERDLADTVCQNQKLQRQMEAEHHDRAVLEERSLAAVRAARSQWAAQQERQQVEQQERQRGLSEQCARLQEAGRELTARLAASTAELSRAQQELQGLQRLQKEHKDSMAKARRLTRQSLVSTEAGREDERQAERERAVRKHEELQRALTLQRDTEQNLRVELGEARKDFADLEAQCSQIPCLENQVRELQEQVVALQKAETCKGDQRSERRLQAEEERDALQLRVEELEFTVCSLESDALEWKREEGGLRERLAAANTQEDKYRKKVTELEELLTKLQKEVARLESDKVERDGATAKAKGNDEKKGAGSERMTFLEERVVTLEQQLRAAHEEAVLIKQEARKANSALWKKEKELADCDLDRRIACRELKGAEERVRAAEEVRVASEARLAALQVELRSTQHESRERADSGERAQRGLALAQAQLDKITAEHDRCKNDILKLKGELQYSENRRLKTEGLAERSATEAGRAGEERSREREERQRLQDLLHQRDAQCRALGENYRVLQEASTMLEEQLLDFERLTELQETTNVQLKEENTRIGEEQERARAELSDLRLQLERACAERAVAEERVQAALEETRQQRECNLDLEKQLDELLERECSLRRELEEQSGRAESEGEARGRAEAQRGALQAQLVALKEELAGLHSQQAFTREDAMRARHELQESQERSSSLRGLVEELEAQGAHWRQRELKAEATIRQHLKLIDFLQAKVEEASKKKKGLGELLFGGRGASKENLPPSLISTPLREKQINKELREQVTELRQRLLSVEGRAEEGTPCTPRSRIGSVVPQFTPSSESKKSASSDQPLMEGWVRIEKEGLLQRVYMELRGLRLRWRGEGAEANLDGARLLVRVPPGRLLLSPEESAHAFMLEIAGGRQLAVVCPSANQRSDWLAGFKEAGLLEQGGEEENVTFSATWGRQLLSTPHASLGALNCVLELDSDILLIGTDKGLSSWVRGREGAMPLTCWEHGGVRAAVLSSGLDCCILLPIGPGAPLCLSLRQLRCVLRALPSSRPRLAAVPLPLDIREACSLLRLCQNRGLLFVASGPQLHLLSHCPQTSSFVLMERVSLPGPARALLLTPHTALLAAPLPLELDLTTRTLEDFLDPSEPGLTVLQTLSPLDILRVENEEYLLCYRELGVFVDGFGQRTRARDVVWAHLPLNFVFRKPFLFTIHSTCVDIIHLTGDSYKHKISGDHDDVSVSTMSTSSSISQDIRVTIDMEAPKYLGKSSAKGSIYISTLCIRKSVQILELYGGDAFKKSTGMSIETLNTSDDTDSCGRAAALDEKEGNSADECSIEVKTDFASHIRQKAKLFSSIKQEKEKVNSIQQLLTGREGEGEEDSSGSELSSSCDERPRSTATSDSSRKQVRFHNR